jgi:hypothetical protein
MKQTSNQQRQLCLTAFKNDHGGAILELLKEERMRVLVEEILKLMALSKMR